MKNVILYLSLCCLSMQLFAQITLERSDYIRAADQSYDEWTVDLSSITAPPTTGSNQVWDYSNINLVRE